MGGCVVCGGESWVWMCVCVLCVRACVRALARVCACKEGVWEGSGCSALWRWDTRAETLHYMSTPLGQTAIIPVYNLAEEES